MTSSRWTRRAVVYREAVLAGDVYDVALGGPCTPSMKVRESPRDVAPTAYDAATLTTDVVEHLVAAVEPA